MVNRVYIIGNVGNSPELKYTASGNAVLNLSIATSEKFHDKVGNKQEKTEWHRIVSFGQQAETLAKYITKGSKLYIEGKLQTRSFEGKDGTKNYSTEIVLNEFRFLDGKSGKDNVQAEDTPF